MNLNPSGSPKPTPVPPGRVQSPDGPSLSDNVEVKSENNPSLSLSSAPSHTMLGVSKDVHPTTAARIVPPSASPFLNGLELIGIKGLNEHLRTLRSSNFACVRVCVSSPPSSRDSPDGEVAKARANLCNFSRLR
jgi:hypothetical protein